MPFELTVPVGEVDSQSVRAKERTYMYGQVFLPKLLGQWGSLYSLVETISDSCSDTDQAHSSSSYKPCCSATSIDGQIGGHAGSCPFYPTHPPKQPQTPTSPVILHHISASVSNYSRRSNRLLNLPGKVSRENDGSVLCVCLCPSLGSHR